MESPLTTPPSSPVPMEEDSMVGSQKVAERTHNRFCCFCQDGGTLYCCSQCRRAVCTFCLVVPEKYKDAVAHDEGIVFCCPGCHELEDRATGSDGKRAFLPYWGFTTKNENGVQVPVLPANPRINTHYGMSSRSEVNDDPLAIIHLYLAGMDPHGSPHASSMNHSGPIFAPTTSSFSNSNLTLGPLLKKPIIN